MAAEFKGTTGFQLRINLTSGEILKQAVDEDVIRKYLGGVGYGARILYDELEKGCDPLGPENKLVVSTSPLSLNKVPGGGSVTLSFKSPLTNGWGEARSGSNFGPNLKRAGFDHIIFEGSSEKPVYLLVDNGKAELKPAEHLLGKSVSEKTALLSEGLPARTNSVMSIGVAGENLVRFAAAMIGDRAAGRCGPGAVMGSKNLIAVVVNGDARIVPADAEAFQKALRNTSKTIRASDMTLGFREFGTVGDTGDNDEDGDYPTMNWRSNNWGKGTDLLDHFQENNLIKSVGCYRGCPVACGRYNAVKEGRFKTPAHEGAEYETMAVFTAYVMNDNMDAAVKCDHMCNELGLDSISTGALISFAMECHERGVLEDEAVDGLDMNWGNAETVIELIERIANRFGLGNTLAEGVRKAAEIIGKGSEAYAIHVKGLEGPAHDPRSGKALGVSYGTANRGMCHIHPLEAMCYDRGKMDWGLKAHGLEDPENVDRWDEKGKGTAVKLLQDGLILPDVLSTCKFLMYCGVTLEHWAGILAGLTGWDIDSKELLIIGERVTNLQRMFNVREGVTRKDDYLPKRCLEIPEFGKYSNEPNCVISDYDALLDEYYDARGWNRETGKPGSEKLQTLELI